MAVIRSSLPSTELCVRRSARSKRSTPSCRRARIARPGFGLALANPPAVAEPNLTKGQALSPLIDAGAVLADAAHRVTKSRRLDFEDALDVVLATYEGQHLDAIRRARFRHLLA